MNQHKHISNLSFNISTHSASLTAMEKAMIQELIKKRYLFTYQSFTLANIAETLNVSSTSLHRLSKKLGYASFTLLKEDYFEITEDHSSHTYPSDYRMMLANTYDMVERTITDEMITLLVQAKNIIIYGMGMSSFLGKMFQIKLQLMGISTQQYDDSRYMRVSSKQLNANEDVIVLLSRSGKPPELIEVMVEANKRNVASILITETPDSPLAGMARYVIYTANVNDCDDAIDTRVHVHIAMDLIVNACALELKKRNGL